jgi:acetyltransferase-like isoleucine patch superfamily enzyme
MHMIQQKLRGYQAPFVDGVPPFRRLGRNVVIEEGTRIFFPESIEIGDDVYIGHDAFLNPVRPEGYIQIGRGSWIGPRACLDAAAGIVIGEDVGIAQYVQILTDEHIADDLTKPVIRTPVWYGRVEVHRGCDLGMNTIVLPGVTIGEGVIVGAGAVVTRDLPPYVVAAGVPARVLRHRSAEGGRSRRAREHGGL